MGMLTEFKAFIARGSVVDLAVGVVIGAAFGKIVTALVDWHRHALVALVTGGTSVADWKYVVSPATVDAAGKQVAAEVAFKYGMVLQTLLDFVIIAFVIFLFLKAYNRLREPAPEAGDAGGRAPAARHPRFPQSRRFLEALTTGP
jgi:large conductance mechanosensitive channel